LFFVCLFERWAGEAISLSLKDDRASLTRDSHSVEIDQPIDVEPECQ
jgi:hypothetical protein